MAGDPQSGSVQHQAVPPAPIHAPEPRRAVAPEQAASPPYRWRRGHPDKVSVIGLAIVSRPIQESDGGERDRHYLTIENVGLVTVVEFQAEVSVNGADWERFSSVCLRNDPHSFERMPPPDFKPVLRLTIRKAGIYVDPRRTLHFDLDELRTITVTDPAQVRVRYRYKNLDGTPFKSPELCEFALVTEE